MSGWAAAIQAGTQLASGIIGHRENRRNLNKQLNLQNDLARGGIRMKVNDAKLAGIHPLYAIGAPPFSASPVGLPGNVLGEGLAAAGQDIGRAMQAKQTRPERFNDQIMRLQVERGTLENDLLRSQIARLNSAQSTPPLPTGSDDNSFFDAVDVVPRQQTSTPMDAPAQEAGVSPQHSFLRNPDGSVSTVRSIDAKERLEEDFVGSMQYALRNNILPMLRGTSRNIPDASLLPKGAFGWKFNRWTNSWTPVYRSDTSHVPRPRRKPRGIRIPRDRRSYNPFTGY